MAAHVQEQVLAEVEARRLAWVRRRFLLFCAAATVLCATGLLALKQGAVPEHAPAVLKALTALAPWSVSLQCLSLITVGVLVAARRGPRTHRGYLRLAAAIVALCMFLELPLALHLRDTVQGLIEATGGGLRIGFGVPILLFMLVMHLVACLIIPWRPLEAILPVTPLLVLYFSLSVLEFLQGRSDVYIIAVLAATVGIVIAPGILVCAVRSAWFSARFSGRAYMERYEEIAAELDLARRIHERFFPAPITDGRVTADFVYEPMRSIGGDFLYLRRLIAAGDSALHIVLIDVTGHGIAAALAVNRLHGELDRIFGATHDPSPGRVLKHLNQYVELTTTRDNMYATAIVMRLDPARREVCWASASHPPAFLVGDGRSIDLAATTVILGALTDADFDPDEQSAPFGPGDRILAYTDGAFELRLATGGMLGLDAFRGIVTNAAGERGWADAVRRVVDERRDGPPTDDLLIVQARYEPSTPSPATP